MFSPSDKNINKVSIFTVPKNVKQIQTFLAMNNFFPHMIYNSAEIIQPIVRLPRKIHHSFGVRHVRSFNKIHDEILNKLTLKHLDVKKELYLFCDASKISICGIPMQKHISKFYPIAFFRDSYLQLNEAILLFVECYLQFSLLAEILGSIFLVKTLLYLQMLIP